MKSITSKLNSRSINLTVSSEVLLCRILGNSMLYVHGAISEKTWKNILSKLVNAIAKSIDKNIDTDRFHRYRFDQELKKLKNACNSKEVIDEDVILSLVAIIFELLGGLPDHTERSGLKRRGDFCLDKCRSIQYSQLIHQEVNTILEASRHGPYAEVHKYDDLLDVCISEYDGDPEGFLKWYKLKYPEVYLDLF